MLVLAPQPRAAAQADGKSQLEQADKFALDGKLNLARAAYERAIKAGEPVEKDYVRSRNMGLCYLNGEPKNLQLAAKWFGIAVNFVPARKRHVSVMRKPLVGAANTTWRHSNFGY
jgi:hypothetical protein